ncbi:DUF4253 domain-containing protein [Cellulophaga omnivescoria]|uniref:DUF4253 domain-containing protein n=1 Tax=Cellulophaga omnivescoria TaxID=1888890 RepID=UPI0022EFFDC1|nr:DUF4253 domain-containing protein [Cellulophaga omnivescoria]WBU89760.1 DUF4253 domain-containing protein [Cellulophaga omnivescoria]
MKQFIYGLLLIILFGCVQDSVNFSKTELLLFKNIGFDKEILSELKKSITDEFFQFEISEPGYVMDKNGKQNKTGIKKLNGVSFKTSENQAYKIILENRGELQSKGYQLFLSEMGYQSLSTVSVIKSMNKFDILRVQKTDGINFDVENKDDIAKLKVWDKKYGIEILGADYDWVHLTFNKDIIDVTAFATEVYDFCPDSVDQGVGELSELERIIREEKRLFLWWD